MERKNDQHFSAASSARKQNSTKIDDAPPNQMDIEGDSVDKLRNLEEANIMLSGDEIKQQNENL
ncbi:hypothetical protein [Bacillus sp. V2I10]|uniref:hypothetical protein n=1 Tax=Bacillus sp. V2I10 TaxID=3042276 RepID=UPI0027895D52|nr:hypothetical protein [Bacillus sp. V2I10]MDQ0859451.1 hypothetical protein [Bacillus sp. V2I10]